MGQVGAKILCPNPSTMHTVARERFWHKLNYFFVLPNFENLFITCVKKNYNYNKLRIYKLFLKFYLLLVSEIL